MQKSEFVFKGSKKLSNLWMTVVSIALSFLAFYAISFIIERTYGVFTVKELHRIVAIGYFGVCYGIGYGIVSLYVKMNLSGKWQIEVEGDNVLLKFKREQWSINVMDIKKLSISGEKYNLVMDITTNSESISIETEWDKSDKQQNVAIYAFANVLCQKVDQEQLTSVNGMPLIEGDKVEVKYVVN
ncbi:hypothetical protein [Myroides sp. N17-2]|uniref:hypothetical protein n=1 Tax=Myroides sp. N17-2 TaxID=2030799 RepID=UPI000EFA60B9|nr:hypothetical protein [Myroides sp. N17-2]